jgi:hypothetical protein
MNKFNCTVESCARKMTGPKKSVNYQISETCRYASNGECTYPAKSNDKKVTDALVN